MTTWQAFDDATGAGISGASAATWNAKTGSMRKVKIDGYDSIFAGTVEFASQGGFGREPTVSDNAASGLILANAHVASEAISTIGTSDSKAQFRVHWRVSLRSVVCISGKT